jgi:biopolymer transport protein ExbB/TolQ
MKIAARTALVVMFTLFASSLFAQQRAGGGMRSMDPEQAADRQLATMKEIIKLDKKEEAKVKELFVTEAKERQKQFQNTGESGNREEMQAKMQEMQKKRDEELTKILGAERMDKYTKEMEKRRSERGRGRGL